MTREPRIVRLAPGVSWAELTENRRGIASADNIRAYKKRSGTAAGLASAERARLRKQAREAHK